MRGEERQSRFDKSDEVVVMKFGGTSVEDIAAIRRLIAIVQSRLDAQPVVVVSALARVTDQLLEAGNAAAKGRLGSALATVRDIYVRHERLADSLVEGSTYSALDRELRGDLRALESLLLNLEASREMDLRSQDHLLGFGECFSSSLVKEALCQAGVKGSHVDARSCIVTDASYGKAVPQEAAIESRLAAIVLPLIDVGKTPVIAGFIGATAEGITTTLGRGGSDYTAALVGGGMHAGAIEIWTDVNGIMTTDPRICPDALRVKTISFEEAAELAYFGAKVLHPATILPAVQKSIPVWVLNSRNPENEGTKITAMAAKCASPFKSIAAKKKLTIIDVVASRMLMSHGYLKAVFDVFDKYKCAIDMVSTSEVSISVTVDSNQQLPEICAELGKIADVKMEGHKALVCLVGEDIRGHNGIAAQVFSAISHVNIRMISQGASEINMSFMIDEEDVEEAVRSLHEYFFANPDETVFDVANRVQLKSHA